jgi:hypothetical protein
MLSKQTFKKMNNNMSEVAILQWINKFLPSQILILMLLGIPIYQKEINNSKSVNLKLC